MSGGSKEELDKQLDEAKSFTKDELMEMGVEIKTVDTNYYKKRYEDLCVIVRNLLGTMTKLDKQRKREHIQYWYKALDSWRDQTKKALDEGRSFDPPVSKQLIDELEDHISIIRRMTAADIKDKYVIADDLEYRVRALYDSLVTLELARENAIIKAHVNLKELMHDRLEALETDASTGDNTERLARIAELKLLLHNERSE